MEFTNKPENKVVLGLGYGDEGKGMAVAHEVERALAFGLRPLVVRFNGGPQAAHNVRVMDDDGNVLHHTHSQFGSGALLGADTIITKGMLFDPLAVAPEASHLSRVTKRDVMRELVVDKSCPVVLPIHAQANQLLERIRGDYRHGSTGRGIGVARTCEAACRGEVDPDMLIDVRSLFDADGLLDRLRFWHKWIMDHFGLRLLEEHDYLRLYGVDFDEPDEGFAESVAAGMRHLCECGLTVTEFAGDMVRARMDGGCVIFEGSQGLLLDRRYGVFPHVTYGDMSARVAMGVAGKRLPVMGVTRSYQTRHGAGPLLTEGTYDAPESDNVTSEWAGGFRTGLLDMTMLRSVTSWEPVNEVAVSCMDRYPGAYCGYDYERVECDAEGFVSLVGDVAHATVSVVGNGNMVHQWEDR